MQRMVSIVRHIFCIPRIRELQSISAMSDQQYMAYVREELG
jgi:hypothetical protein